MENYIFYYVLQRINFNKVVYSPGEVFAADIETDLSELVKDKTLVKVDDHVAEIERTGKAKIEELTEAIKTHKVDTEKAKATVLEKQKKVEAVIQEEIDAKNAQKESVSADLAQGIAKHLSKQGVQQAGTQTPVTNNKP